MAELSTAGNARQATAALPGRFQLPGTWQFLAWLLLLTVLFTSLRGVGISLTEFVHGLPQMLRVVREMSPPNLDRIDAIGRAMLETARIAVAGWSLGIALSFVLAALAARNQAPRPIAYAVRGLVALFRTVPDLVWAIFFVVSVGLGAFAGTLAIMVDTIGFCGRFFADAMEEADRGPQEALAGLGASRPAILFAAVVPTALPALINVALFALEKAIRSSVVLGLVGAGGIGIELTAAMEMFEYDTAATVILCILALVLTVEQLSGLIRKRVL